VTDKVLSAAPVRAGAVTPNSLAARVLVAILTTAGLFYVDVLPALVIGLQDGLGFTPQQAGYVVAANVYGAAAGGLLAVFLVGRLSWRPASVVALLLLIGADTLSTQIASPQVMVVVRLVDGLIGGVLVGLGYSIIARMHAPERTFAMLLAIQFGLGGLGVFSLPQLVEQFGASILFIALIAFSVLALVVLPLIPEHASLPAAARGTSTSGARTSHYAGFVAALCAVFLFQASSMGVSAFVFNIGRKHGLPIEFVSTQAGLAHIVAAAGAMLVFGAKRGKLVAIALGVAVAIISRSLFLGAGALKFAIAIAGSAATHAFVLPYLLGVCASFDLRGRLTTFAGFVSKLGLASGPAIGALLIAGDDFRLLITTALIGLAAAGLSATLALRWRREASERRD
jgi:DHA1 family inner membrane transport protein